LGPVVQGGHNLNGVHFRENLCDGLGAPTQVRPRLHTYREILQDEVSSQKVFLENAHVFVLGAKVFVK
jgi:hypothetical protein